MPDPSALTTFAALGLAVSLVYLLASAVFTGLALIAASARATRSRLRHPPGFFLEREVRRTNRRLRRHGHALLLFCIVFGMLAAFGRPDTGPQLPLWAMALVACLMAACAAWVIFKCSKLLAFRRRLMSVLEADCEVAQRLEYVQLRGYRVYHAVPVGPALIDHVIVGAEGVFAVQLVLPMSAGAQSVSLSRGSLVFGPHHGEFRLKPVTEAFSNLARELTRVAGQPVKVVPTLIAPGCTVTASDEQRYLLANEQTCVSLVGWKDAAAYLMDDQVSRIAEWLGSRSLPPRRWAWRLPAARQHACAPRPGML